MGIIKFSRFLRNVKQKKQTCGGLLIGPCIADTLYSSVQRKLSYKIAREKLTGKILLNLRSRRESWLNSSDECRTTQSACRPSDLRVNRSELWVRSFKLLSSACYPPFTAGIAAHPQKLIHFLVWFYHPTEGRRLSWPRHYNWCT